MAQWVMFSYIYDYVFSPHSPEQEAREVIRNLLEGHVELTSVDKQSIDILTKNKKVHASIDTTDKGANNAYLRAIRPDTLRYVVFVEFDTDTDFISELNKIRESKEYSSEKFNQALKSAKTFYFSSGTVPGINVEVYPSAKKIPYLDAVITRQDFEDILPKIQTSTAKAEISEETSQSTPSQLGKEEISLEKDLDHQIHELSEKRDKLLSQEAQLKKERQQLEQGNKAKSGILSFFKKGKVEISPEIAKLDQQQQKISQALMQLTSELDALLKTKENTQKPSSPSKK